MKRRTLLKLLGATPALPLGRGSASSDSAVTVGGLEELADRYQAIYHSAAPLDLMAPVVTHLRTIDRLMRAGVSPAERQRLLLNRSRVGTLAGRIAFFDLGDSLSARGYLTTAAEAAGEAGEPLLAAAALGHLAFIPAAEHGYGAARDYLRGANRQLELAPHGGIEAWLAAVETEILTNAGEERLALESADRAQLALGAGEHQVLPWFDYFDATRLNGFRGYAELKFGRLDDARATLGAATASLPAHAVKQRAVFLADLAAVEVAAFDVDAACELALDANESLRLAGYATGNDRLREIHRTLSPWRTHPGVRLLSEELNRKSSDG